MCGVTLIVLCILMCLLVFFVTNLVDSTPRFHPRPIQVGITPNHLRNLPMATIDEDQVENGAECSICLEPYEINEEVVVLGCRHMFHRNCLEPWLRENISCPYCRANVNPYDWPGNNA